VHSTHSVSTRNRWSSSRAAGRTYRLVRHNLAEIQDIREEASLIFRMEGTDRSAHLFSPPRNQFNPQVIKVQHAWA
jgi:hypothetical protein